MQLFIFALLVFFGSSLAIRFEQDQLHPYGPNDKVDEQISPDHTSNLQQSANSQGKPKFLLHQLVNGGGQQNNYHPVPVPYPIPYPVHSAQQQVPQGTHHVNVVPLLPVAPIYPHYPHYPSLPHYPNYPSFPSYPNYNNYNNYNKHSNYPPYIYGQYPPGGFFGK